MLLKDKSVVITGAGSGVGRAASLIFSRNGAKLICADVNKDWVDQTVALVREQGGTAEAIRCDVTKPEDTVAAVALAVAAYGRLDVMYNNVGVATSVGGVQKTFLDQDINDYERLDGINFKGMTFGCQAAVRQFVAQGGGGAIVNTGSVAGIVGFGGPMYGGSKSAGHGLTRAIAIEFAKQGIRCNAVCPAAMATNFGRDGVNYASVSQEGLDRIGQLHPMGKPIDPEDCANAALFLASDLAKNITGVLLPVDGGYTAA